MAFTIEYKGFTQTVRVYDGKPRKTELLLGCPASPPDGAIKVVPRSPGLRTAHRMIDALGRRPLVIDVSRMKSGSAVFAISRFAARASDYFTSGVNEVALDEQSAYEWGYEGPADAAASGPTAPLSA
jgi:hypothetical protein